MTEVQYHQDILFPQIPSVGLVSRMLSQLPQRLRLTQAARLLRDTAASFQLIRNWTRSSRSEDPVLILLSLSRTFESSGENREIIVLVRRCHLRLLRQLLHLASHLHRLHRPGMYSRQTSLLCLRLHILHASSTVSAIPSRAVSSSCPDELPIPSHSCFPPD